MAGVKQTNLKFLSNPSSQPQKFPPNLARRKDPKAGRNLEIEYIAALRAADQIRRQADKQQSKEPEELGELVHSTRGKENAYRSAISFIFYASSFFPYYLRAEPKIYPPSVFVD